MEEGYRFGFAIATAGGAVRRRQPAHRERSVRFTRMDYQANWSGVDHFAARGGVISDVPGFSRFARSDNRPNPAASAVPRLARSAARWQGKPGERSTSALTGRSIQAQSKCPAGRPPAVGRRWLSPWPPR